MKCPFEIKGAVLSTIAFFALFFAILSIPEIASNLCYAAANGMREASIDFLENQNVLIAETVPTAASVERAVLLGGIPVLHQPDFTSGAAKLVGADGKVFPLNSSLGDDSVLEYRGKAFVLAMFDDKRQLFSKALVEGSIWSSETKNGIWISKEIAARSGFGCGSDVLLSGSDLQINFHIAGVFDTSKLSLVLPISCDFFFDASVLQNSADAIAAYYFTDAEAFLTFYRSSRENSEPATLPYAIEAFLSQAETFEIALRAIGTGFALILLPIAAVAEISFLKKRCAARRLLRLIGQKESAFVTFHMGFLFLLNVSAGAFSAGIASAILSYFSFVAAEIFNLELSMTLGWHVPFVLSSCACFVSEASALAVLGREKKTAFQIFGESE